MRRPGARAPRERRFGARDRRARPRARADYPSQWRRSLRMLLRARTREANGSPARDPRDNRPAQAAAASTRRALGKTLRSARGAAAAWALRTGVAWRYGFGGT